MSGISTFRAVKPTSDFKFKTMDYEDNLIDYHGSYFLPPFQALRKIESASAFSEQKEVGKLGTYIFTFQSPVPLFSGDTLLLEGPTIGASKELAYNFESCKGIEKLSPNLTCMLKGINGIEVTLEFSAEGKLPPLTEFAFEISAIQNPLSTRPSGSFKATVSDFQGNFIIETSPSPSFVLQATTPSSLIYASVTSDNRSPSRETILKFTIITQHELEPHSNLVMTLPALLRVKKEAFAAWVSTSPDSLRKYQLTEREEEGYGLKVEDVNQKTIIGGTSIDFELRGLINAMTTTPSASYTISTQTHDGFLVDQQLSNLIVAAACNYPCITCPQGEPDVCRSCDLEGPNGQVEGAQWPILHLERCIEQCPKGTFFRDYRCPRCDDDCMECVGQS